MSETKKTPTYPAKVVRVLDDYNIVINRGRLDGVKSQQRMLIYALENETTRDPDTGAELGRLELVKGRGIVAHVQDHMSTIRSTMRAPSVERRVKRQGAFNVLGPETETVTEVGETIPYEVVEVGDFVKPI